MRWLADECIHADVVRSLRADGHDVFYAAESARQAPDRSLVVQAMDERRIIVTEDKDFGEIVFGEGRETRGIVLLRLPPRLWRLKGPLLRDAIALHGEALYDRFTVIEETRLRSQPLPTR
jgi:predicted nuclease of predicted toxin-antitoxin system